MLHNHQPFYKHVKVGTDSCFSYSCWQLCLHNKMVVPWYTDALIITSHNYYYETPPDIDLEVLGI